VRVGLITRDAAHPLLAGAAGLLAARGARVEVLAPDAAEVPADPADVYLLKARTPQALRLAAALEARGAGVVNSAAATARCQDRTAMAQDALAAGLPFAPTRTYASAAELAAGEAESGGIVVKSRHSRKDDVVVRLEGPAAVRDFAAGAPAGEPYVVQDLVRTDGWDHKLWAVGAEVFAAVRPSELDPAPGPPPPALPLDVWRPLLDRAGEAFGLDVHGVDVLLTPEGPVVVDVNAFPGVRGQDGAPRALADLALRAAQCRAR
jgi:ribosomal protein S6--L-glutamate ligase